MKKNFLAFVKHVKYNKHSKSFIVRISRTDISKQISVTGSSQTEANKYSKTDIQKQILSYKKAPNYNKLPNDKRTGGSSNDYH